jgi:hypothetical protein
VGVERDAPKKSKREGGWGDGIGTESRRRRLGWLVRAVQGGRGDFFVFWLFLNNI